MPQSVRNTQIACSRMTTSMLHPGESSGHQIDGHDGSQKAASVIGGMWLNDSSLSTLLLEGMMRLLSFANLPLWPLGASHACRQTMLNSRLWEDSHYLNTYTPLSLYCDWEVSVPWHLLLMSAAACPSINSKENLTWKSSYNPSAFTPLAHPTFELRRRQVCTRYVWGDPPATC